jgi:hypothetical protein
MMVAMPLYEVRYKDCEEWEQISEIELLDSLYTIYKKVTPAIKEMINGREIVTPGAIYRLKMQSNVQPKMIAANFAAAQPRRLNIPGGDMPSVDVLRKFGA